MFRRGAVRTVSSMTSTALIDLPKGLAALPTVSRDEAAASTPGPDAWAYPWVRLVVGCLAAEDFEGARRLLADAARGADRRQSALEATTVDQLRLRVALYEGRLAVVRASAQEAIATATWRGEAGSGTVATAHAVLAVVAVEHGPVEDAARHARGARRLGVFADGLPATDLVMLAEALSFDLLSRPDLGVQAIRPFLHDPTGWEDAILAGPRIVAVACHTAVAAGQPALALRTIRSAEAIARDHGEP